MLKSYGRKPSLLYQAIEIPENPPPEQLCGDSGWLAAFATVLHPKQLLWQLLKGTPLNSKKPLAKCNTIWLIMFLHWLETKSTEESNNNKNRSTCSGVLKTKKNSSSISDMLVKIIDWYFWNFGYLNNAYRHNIFVACKITTNQLLIS